MSETPLKPLSDAIFDPVNRAFRAGGFALAFLSLGAFLMLLAYFLPNGKVPPIVVLLAGLALIMTTCTLFYVKEVSPLLRAQRQIGANRAYIDEVQQAAIQMTLLAAAIESLAFKHASQAAELLKVVDPYIHNIPFLEALMERSGLRDSGALYAFIVEASESTKRTISDLQDALTRSDPSHLKDYVEKLQQLRTHVNDVLRDTGRAVVVS